MRTKVNLGFIAAAVLCALLFAGYLDGATTSTPPKPSTPSTTPTPPKPPAPTWVVIEVMNWKGVVSYEAIGSKAVHDRNTRQVKEYKQAVEKWKKDKALADINKTKFNTPRPVRGYVHRVQTTPATFRYADLARAEAAMLTKKLKEREAAAAENKTSTPSDAKTTEPSKPHAPPSGKIVTPAETDDNETETDDEAP